MLACARLAHVPTSCRSELPATFSFNPLSIFFFLFFSFFFVVVVVVVVIVVVLILVFFYSVESVVDSHRYYRLLRLKIARLEERERERERSKQTNRLAAVRPDASAVRMQITVERGATRPYGGPSLSARSRPANRFSLRPLRILTCLHQQQRHSIQPLSRNARSSSISLKRCCNPRRVFKEQRAEDLMGIKRSRVPSTSV